MSELMFLDGTRSAVLVRRLWRPALVLTVLAGVALAFHASRFQPADAALSPAGVRAIAVFAGAMILWLTEAVPLIVTGLGVFTALVAAQLPIDGKIAGPAEVSGWFGDRVVFFLLGVFLIAGSLDAAHVVDHLALRLVGGAGGGPRRLRQGVFWSAFGASWLLAEHAVAAMLFPIICRLRDASGRAKGDNPYAASLFLALAWGCTIGGIVTYLGGARIALAMGIAAGRGIEVPSFFGLMAYSLPIAIPMGLSAALLLELVFPADRSAVAPARAALATRRRELGRFGPRQVIVSAIVLTAIACWAMLGTRHLATVALGTAAVLIGSGLVRWRDAAAQVPWDLLLMQGAALALCAAMQGTGVAAWAAAGAVGGLGNDPWLLALVIAGATIALTELFSNPAVVTLLVPVLITMAPALGADPLHLTLIVALACGMSFAIPLGSPPLAIAFSAGELRFRTVLLWGLLLDALAVAFTVLASRMW